MTLLPKTIKGVFTCFCLVAFGQSALAQGGTLVWQNSASGQLVARTDTVAVSWFNDALAVSLGKVNENFNVAVFVEDVVCTALFDAGKPANVSVSVTIFSLSFDGTEWQEDLLVTDVCN